MMKFSIYLNRHVFVMSTDRSKVVPLLRCLFVCVLFCYFFLTCSWFGALGGLCFDTEEFPDYRHVYMHILFMLTKPLSFFTHEVFRKHLCSDGKQTKFEKWFCFPSEMGVRESCKKICHWVRLTSVLHFLKHIFITNLQSIPPLLKHIFVTFLFSREKQINSLLLVSVGDTDK